MKKNIQALSLSLLLVFCLTLTPSMGHASDVVAGENPLQGLELDLVFLDALTAMLKMNNVMLNQMPITADAKWIDELEKPDMDKATEKAYSDWLEKETKRNFSFFSYYGDMSISDLISFKKMGERPVIEGAQYMIESILHQRKVMSYKPDGCDSPAILGKKKISSKACSKLISSRRQACRVFNRPIEEQIFNAFMKKKGMIWVDEAVNRRCLRTVKTKSKKGNSFESAFISLLDPSLVNRYKKTQKEVDYQAKETMKIKQAIATLEMKKQKLEDANDVDEKRIGLLTGKISFGFGDIFGSSEPTPEEIKEQQAIAKMPQKKKDAEVAKRNAAVAKREAKIANLDAAFKPLEEKLDKQEDMFDDAVDAYQGFMEEAEETIVVNNKNSVLLAQKMLTVANAAYDNMGKAVSCLPVVMGKCALDICYLGSAAPQMAALPQTLAIETIQVTGKSKREALKIAKKRIKLTLERSIMLIPNLFNTASQIYTQYELTDPKIDYLEKVVDAGEDLIKS
ncbi:hypothetical protein [Maridesulfovibrio sp.]|uniref:hypothetical protein n=1 Tax=Maridesulfovibrio sp. TaxID=2795000 RepID=UPI0029C9C869|nr:hypothetical protein [Maridesulfovibrio sp.]